MLGSGTYRGVLTMHGTLLVFFVLVPVVTGLARTRAADDRRPPDRACRASRRPRFWLFVFAGAAVVLSAFASGGASQAGWTGYPPLALTQEGNGVGLWLIGLLLLGVSLLGSAINLVATIRSLRTDGMTWREPADVRLVGIRLGVGDDRARPRRRGRVRTACSSSDDTPARSTSSSRRHRQTKADLAVRQSFAYVALVPVLGIVAEIVAVFSGRAIANARVLGQSLVGIGGLMILVVLYHAYSVGVGRKPSVLLLLLAVVAALPSVVALWLLKSSLWRARRELRWTAPLLFAGGAIVLFAIGILSALVLVVFGNDRELRGTAFGVAHAHYLLWGTALLALLGGLVYWWPKIYGRLLGTRSHEPRPCCSSSASTARSSSSSCSATRARLGAPGFSAHGSTSAYNMISTIGAFATAVGALLFLVAVARAHRTAGGPETIRGSPIRSSGTRRRRRRSTTSTPSRRSRARDRCTTSAAR